MTCITHVPCHARIIIISPSLCSLRPCSSAAGAPPSVYWPHPYPTRNHPASERRTGTVCFCRGPRSQTEHQCSRAQSLHSGTWAIKTFKFSQIYTLSKSAFCKLLQVIPWNHARWAWQAWQAWGWPWFGIFHLPVGILTQRHPTIPTRTVRLLVI